MPESRSPLPALAPALPCWRGELLWPDVLPEASIIDISDVGAMGSWLHGWLRARPGIGLIGASSMIRQQLARAAVPVLHYRSVADAMASGLVAGVSPAERDMLLEVEDLSGCIGARNSGPGTWEEG